MSEMTTRNGLGHSNLAWSSLKSASSSSNASNGSDIRQASGQAASSSEHLSSSESITLSSAQGFPEVWAYPWLDPSSVKLAREARRALEVSQLVVGLVAQRELSIHAQASSVEYRAQVREKDFSSASDASHKHAHIVAERLQRTLNEVGQRVADFTGAMGRDAATQAAEVRQQFAADVNRLRDELEKLQDQASAILPRKNFEAPWTLVARSLDQLDAGLTWDEGSVQAQRYAPASHSSVAQAGSVTSLSPLSPLVAASRFV